MVGFIDAHREAHGIGLICDMRPVAPSTCHEHPARWADPSRLSDRSRRDGALRPEIRRVFAETWRINGVRKSWRQRHREGSDLARRTVAWLMKVIGIQGITRGK